MVDRYRAVCDYHNWRGVTRNSHSTAELDAQEHEQEYERPGCQFVEVEEV